MLPSFALAFVPSPVGPQVITSGIFEKRTYFNKAIGNMKAHKMQMLTMKEKREHRRRDGIKG